MKKENKELLTAKEASELLSINEKKVYALAQEGKLPGTKVTGKWIFPRTELEDYLKLKSQQTLRKSFFESVIDRKVILICGSDDPLLCVAHGMFHNEYPAYTLFSSSVGSGEGLRLLSRGFCHVAVTHLYDPVSDDFNFPFLPRHFTNGDDLVLFNLFYRNVGFVSRGEPVASFRECIDRKLRFENRQEGSGIRVLVDYMLEKEEVSPRSVKGYESSAFTHFDVVRAVVSGDADTGVVTESAARGADLFFSKIFEERFDMVVQKEIFFDRNIQIFIEFLRSELFRNLLTSMKGYDSRDTGKILYPKSRDR